MDKEKLTYGLAIAGFWLNVIFGGLAAWMNVEHMLWVPFLIGAGFFLIAIALWDYRKMTKAQMVKQLARLFFGFGLGVGVTGVLWNWYQGISSKLWIFGFLIAFASSLVGMFYGANVNWKELRDQKQDRRRPQVPRQSGDGQQFAIVGHSSSEKMFSAGWGGAAAKAVLSHWLPIAGILLALITVSYGATNHSEAADWIVLTLLIVATVAVFLAFSGVLKSFLRETLTNHLAKAWLFVSLVVALLLWKYAHDDGFTFGEMPQVWIALASAVVASLVILGLLKPLLQAVGGVLHKAYGFGYHPFLTLVLWGITLIAMYVIAVMVASQEFFDPEVPENVFQVAKWLGAGGVFLVLLSPLAFKKDKK